MILLPCLYITLSDISIMTDMYDKPRKFERTLKPYPHEEFGVEVSTCLNFPNLSLMKNVMFYSYSCYLSHVYYLREDVRKTPWHTCMMSSNVLENGK